MIWRCISAMAAAFALFFSLAAIVMTMAVLTPRIIVMMAMRFGMAMRQPTEMNVRSRPMVWAAVIEGVSVGHRRPAEEQLQHKKKRCR